MSPRDIRDDAVQSILKNNLFGLDIDKRAAQLSYFAVMMKARQYDRRIFGRSIKPHVYAIAESNEIDQFTVEYFVNGDAKIKADIDSIMEEMHDAREYGSILNVTLVDFFALYSVGWRRLPGVLQKCGRIQIA